jgi:hypothetical protein
LPQPVFAKPWSTGCDITSPVRASLDHGRIRKDCRAL